MEKTPLFNMKKTQKCVLTQVSRFYWGPQSGGQCQVSRLPSSSGDLKAGGSMQEALAPYPIPLLCPPRVYSGHQLLGLPIVQCAYHSQC